MCGLELTKGPGANPVGLYLYSQHLKWKQNCGESEIGLNYIVNSRGAQATLTEIWAEAHVLQDTARAVGKAGVSRGKVGK